MNVVPIVLQSYIFQVVYKSMEFKLTVKVIGRAHNQEKAPPEKDFRRKGKV